MREKEKFKCFEAKIIGGDLKGKKILIPNLNTTRSSKAILRESLFNTLQFDIIGKNFVEVFAGSGSVGIEALSRGAEQALFIEKNPNAYQVLCHNIKALGLSNSVTIRGDSFVEFAALYATVKRSGLQTYFYFDPPFSTRDGMDDIYDKTLTLMATIEPEVCAMVIVEHISSVTMPETVGSLHQTKQKRFGKSTLSYYSAAS